MAEELKYCPNCGAEIAATDEFCGKCGFDLKAFRAGKIQVASSSADSTSADTAVKPSRPRTATKAKRTSGRKRRKRWPWILGGVVLLLILCFVGGAWYYSKDNQANRLATQVTSTDDDDIADAVVDDNSQKVDDDAVKPLQSLYESNPSTRASIKQSVKSNDSSNSPFEMVASGHHFLFTRYVLQAKQFRLTVKTNVKNATITNNGDAVAAKPVSGGYALEGLFPGRYTMQIAGNVSGSSQSVTKLLPATNIYKQLDSTMKVSVKADQTASSQTSAPQNNSNQSSDSNDDSSGSTDYSYDTSLRNDNTDDDILIGDWRSSAGTWEFNDDGTYEGEDTNDNDLSGTWEVVYHKGNYWNIKFDHDDGKTDVEPYRYENDQLVQCQMKLHWHSDD